MSMAAKQPADGSMNCPNGIWDTADVLIRHVGIEIS